jgi:phage protein D
MKTAAIKVFVGGNDVTNRFYPTLVSASVMRSARDEADSADLVLADPDGQTFMPETGDDVIIHMGTEEDGVGQVFEGFIDTVRGTGGKSSGRTISIVASSVDFKSPAKAAGLRSASDKTFEEVAGDWGQKAGLTVTVAGDLASEFRSYWIMQHESFMGWGQRMAHELGASFKVIGKRAFFAPLNEGISATGKTLTPVYATWGDNLLDWDISPVRGRPQFGRTIERHYDLGAASWKEVYNAVAGAAVDLDFRAPVSSANRENAEQRSKAASKGVERSTGDGSVTILGDYAAEPEAQLILQGTRPGLDGSYTIEGLTHTMSKGDGFTTSLELVRPTAGAGKDTRGGAADQERGGTRNGIQTVDGTFGGATT